MAVQEADGAACVACQAPFDADARCPRLLRCGHSLCTRCVAVKGRARGGGVVCAVCGVRTALSAGSGASGLAKSFHLLLQVAARRGGGGGDGPRLCELGCSDDDHDATAHCLDCAQAGSAPDVHGLSGIPLLSFCAQDICDIAARIHLRASANRTHRVVPLADAPAPGAARAAALCPEHGEPLKLFDTTCTRLVCHSCVALQHKQHDFQPLEAAAASARGEVQALLTAADAQAAQLQRGAAARAATRVEWDDARRTADGRIRTTFAEIRTWVDERERALLDDVGAVHAERTAALDQQRTALSAFSDSARALRPRTNAGLARVGAAVEGDGGGGGGGGGAGGAANGPVSAASVGALFQARDDVSASLAALRAQAPPVALADAQLSFTCDVEAVRRAVAAIGTVRATGAAAAASTAAGEGVEHARPGQPARFVITARERDGTACGAGGEAFEVMVGARIGAVAAGAPAAADEEEKMAADVSAAVTVADGRDGTYAVTYTLAADSAGKARWVAVRLRGAHVRGSPFAVRLVRGAPVRGRFVRAFGREGSKAGEFGARWLHVAVAAGGDLFVVDRANHCVQVFRPDGTFVRTWGSEGAARSQFNAPCGACVSAAGEVYIADEGNNRIQVFAASGAFLRAFGSKGAGDGQLRQPVGVALSAAGDEVFVSDCRNHRVSVFRARDGFFLCTFGSEGKGDGQLQKPLGVAVSAAGEVFVADADNHRVCVFRGSDGAFLRKFGAEGDGDGQLRRPCGVAVTAAGEVLVTSDKAPRCQVFRAADGAFVRAFGAAGSGEGQWNGGAMVAVGGRGEVVLGDCRNGRVQIFE